MFFPSTTLGRWEKTNPTILSRICLVSPIPHGNYTRIIYPYITGGFNYFVTFTVYLLRNECNRSRIISSASCAEVEKSVYEHSLRTSMRNKMRLVYDNGSMFFPINNNGLVEKVLNKFEYIQKIFSKIIKIWIYLIKNLNK